MSAEGTAFTLKEILLGIADSLTQAQHQLRSLPPYDEYGRPNVQYTLPYLDFNLEVETSFEQKQEGALPPQSLARSRELSKYETYSDKAITYRPVKRSAQSTSNTNRNTTTISGRFVAVMPNEGLPQLVIQTETEDAGSGLFNINVELFTAAGEKVPAALVEFNYNPFESERINKAPLSMIPEFKQQAEMETNVVGKATCKIKLSDADYSSKKIAVIDINVGVVSKSISINKTALQ